MTTIPTHENGAAAETQPPRYLTLELWVTDYFTPMFLHRIGDATRHRWCTQWWDHAEAIARLTLLWTTWETARWDPNAKAGWWLDLDHHLPILLAADGPFRTCRPAVDDRPAKHEPGKPPVNDLAPISPWT
ncbi:DUF4913 domain-containing protein [Cryptosporangium aurantiacum]|uniref:DUF4913 domain-containing protein n=1 Tax=Cryptosporangium aurantiacum TaxID=134849 RepID=A0A1M7PR38_9ACTN|nr:DUF4913 domain-containing protein [Cryptosporangium aurantiacum]SHN19780.1 protein of unknown function [Cryptosporangium aurantiacum]